MKKLVIILINFFFTHFMYSQDITGQWNGILKVQGTQLRLVFNINQNEEGYVSTMDSPDQKAKGIPISKTTFVNSNLKLELFNMGAAFEGNYKEGKINGFWKQGGQSLPLLLSKETVEKEKVNRPQYPVKPYSYYEEDVIFKNAKDNISLAGTLTLPQKDGMFPVVILISGSGPQNRDEEVFGHKPFLVLADHLTKNGIAVLRFDDRGVGESEGKFGTATTKDFANDVESAVLFLKTRDEIDKNNIGLIGHSEGGIIAPMVAARSEDIAHIILLAGTGVSGKQTSLIQAKTLRPFEIEDEDEHYQFVKRAIEIAVSEKDITEIRKELANHYKTFLPVLKKHFKEGEIEPMVRQEIMVMTRPWNKFFYNYNPADELEKVTCPVLSLNGSKDLQVIPKVNQGGIRNALIKGNNKDFIVKELPGLNHMFQECESGEMSEYAELEQTFSPIALKEITDWLKRHIQ